MRAEPTAITLRPVDSVDVTVIVDNSIDLLLPDDEHASRPDLGSDWLDKPQLRAEHGFSSLVTIRSHGDERRLLYDAGLTGETLVHNLGVLGITLKDLSAVILSHGHGDHHGGLEGLLRTVGKRKLPLIIHPDAWKCRKIVFPTGVETRLPPPDRKMLAGAGMELVESKGPSLLVEDTVLVSGQVERRTAFEQGFPLQWAQGESGWEPDPMIWDDQYLLCHVRGRGLVILTGCSHAGAINIVDSACHRTGVNKIHAILGGFHLSGKVFEPVITPTLRELERRAPDIVVPGHCTGWKARQGLAERFPRGYVESSVGTTFRFS